MSTPSQRATQARRQLGLFYRSMRARKPSDADDYSGLEGPDLIYLADDYLNARTRIALIGQQVGGWYYTYPEFLSQEWTVPKAISKYKEFNFAEDEPRYRNSPFWRFYRQVMEFAFPNDPYTPGKILWTNLVKFVGRGGASIIEKPFTEAEDAIQLQEEILKTELSIARPEICIFVTGPDFDCVLKRYYRGLTLVPVGGHNNKLIVRLVHRDLPYRSYRTYHPQYLVRQKKWRPVFRALTQEMNSNKTPQNHGSGAGARITRSSDVARCGSASRPSR